MTRAAVVVLLVLGVGVQFAASVGVLRMRDAYQRLHYAAAASTLGPVAIAAAVVVDEKFDATGLEAVLTTLVILAGGALVVHATGHAARVRDHDGWTILDDEVEHRQR